MVDSDTATQDAEAGAAKAKRVKPTEGWIKEGDIFSKVVECESPQAAMKLARKILTKAQKLTAPVTLGFHESGLKVGLPADGKKFSSAAKGIARSLNAPSSDKAEAAA